MELPALFAAANEAADRSQATYLRLIRSEYCLLLLASILALGTSQPASYYTLYALVFVTSIGLLLYRTMKRPEQDWYKCRALAESIRTSTWRYAMRAAPFDADDILAAHAAFRGYLHKILESNRHIGDKLAGFSADGAQTTVSMDGVRDMPLVERREYYLANRIHEQRSWYCRKAGWNKRAAKLWTVTCVTTYVAALILILMRIAYPHWNLWPIGPLVVLASAAIGWMQIKKFNELSSSYTLTAHEIGLTQGRIEDVQSEVELSEFVNEAELVFSREHTQWVARQYN